MNPTDYRNLAALAMSEDELQNNIISPSRNNPGLAPRLGYMCYHTHDSRRSTAGFPDLVMVGPHRLIFAELKKEKGVATAAQLDWLNRLDVIERKSEGLVVARLWRPSDWLSNEIEEVLR